MTKPATEERVAYTPTPWKIGRIRRGRSSAHVWIKKGNNTAIIADVRNVASSEPKSDKGCPETEANAAFIVTACNAHEALVSALRGLDKFATHSGCLGESERFPDVCACGYLQALKAGRAALSLATQKGAE